MKYGWDYFYCVIKDSRGLHRYKLFRSSQQKCIARFHNPWLWWRVRYWLFRHRDDIAPVRLRLCFTPDSNCYLSITQSRPRVPADMGHMQHDGGDGGSLALQTQARSEEGPLTIARPTDSSQHSRKLGSGSCLGNWDFHEIRVFLETPIKSGFYDNYNRFTTQLIQTLTLDQISLESLDL